MFVLIGGHDVYRIILQYTYAPRNRNDDWLTGAAERFGAQWLALIAEAERLKDTDPGAPQALDLARRALSFAAEFTRFDPELMASVKAVFREGYADPEMAPTCPARKRCVASWTPPSNASMPPNAEAGESLTPSHP